MEVVYLILTLSFVIITFISLDRRRLLKKVGTRIFGAGNFKIVVRNYIEVLSESKIIHGVFEGIEFLVSRDESTCFLPFLPTKLSVFTISAPSSREYSVSLLRWASRLWLSTFNFHDRKLTHRKDLDDTFLINVCNPEGRSEFVQQPEFCEVIEKLKKLDGFYSLTESYQIDRISELGPKWDCIIQLQLTGSLNKYTNPEKVQLIFDILRRLAKLNS